MKVKKKLPPKPKNREKNYRIRFRDSDQLALIKKAAAQQGISFNFFVADVCEKTARVLLRNAPVDGSKVVTNAVLEAFSKE